MQEDIIGFVGLGQMGAAIAQRLLAAGHKLMVYDLNPQAIRPLEQAGAQVAPDLATLARTTPVVFMSLPSVEATHTVVGALQGGQCLKVVVETSTVGPAAVRSVAALLASQGVELVDAPVSGGPRGAAAGTLSVMHAASPSAMARVLPLLETIAGKRFDVGAVPGLAQVCKLVNNAISAAGMVAACEATVVGIKAGLDADTLLAAINAGSGRNAATIDKFPGAILPGSFDYGGPMGLMLKDLSLYLQEASAAGVPQSVVPAALAAWQTAVDRSGFDADYSRVICHLEADAGVQVRSGASRR
ncbi:MAG: NAD(P)-dependent oxidoreductase [Ramlibacter sp.]|uniref:NAD(P)-dependent oxidoreductase n=1 Tax=Ramlibacter sp. TaxID=1917967 RepID=UPI00261C0C5F|nr:NAD(P)-dependent oxidoreductase [Ramlibacter sp.]MDH4377522.1 NAD(P)-dependent oxidoreductase [Ramlibacter sp.]